MNLDNPDISLKIESAGARAKEIAEILDKLSDFNRLSENEDTKQEVSIKSVLNEIASSYKNLELSIKNDLPLVSASTNQIRLIFKTIIESGLNNYDTGSSCMKIESISSKRATVIKVSDNGNGFSSQSLSKMFLPYHTENEQISVDQHLKFAMVKSVIVSLGWEIDVKSELGSGSNYYIGIPSKDIIELRPKIVNI